MEEFFENELAKRFEEMVENKNEIYFDSEELEDIVVYYLELGDITFAEMAVKYGLKIHPNSIEIKTKYLEVLLELEQYVLARPIIEELKATSMDNTDYLVCCAKYYSNLGNPRKSIEYCLIALELGEEENFLNNFIADEFVNLGDPAKALKHYHKALKADPTDDYSLENIMQCYNELKKYDEATQFINEYLDEFAFSETAWFEYGQFYFNRKNYHEAIKGFDYLLAINSSSVGVYANKAACYEALGEYLKAVDVYQEMLELEYTKAYTYYKIGLCYKELKFSVNALSFFQKSLIEDPQFYMAMIELSELHEEMGSMKEALHFAIEAAALNGTNLTLQKKLAFLYIDAGQFEESLECLELLVKREPNKFYNWYAYTEVLMLLSQFDKAIRVLTKAINLHQHAELYYQISNCFFHLEQKEKALEALEIAIVLDPSLVKDMQERYPYIKDVVKKVKAKRN